MENRRQKFLFAALLCLCVAVTGFRLAAPDQFAIWMQVMPAERVVTYGSTDWQELTDWDFSRGHFPDAWGWGEYEIRDGNLVMSDDDGDFSVYFTPIEHGGNFILETDFQIEPGPGPGPSEAHLITRDSNQLNSECGLAVYGGDHRGFLRNTVHGTHHLREVVDLGKEIEPGQWHTARLEYKAGRISASVDGLKIRVPDQRYPSTLYAEPHFAVRNGTATFRNIKILSRMGTMSIAGRHHRSDLMARLQPWQSPSAAVDIGADLLGGASPSASRTAGARLASARPPGFSGLQPPPLPPRDGLFVLILKIIFALIIASVCIYIVRHFIFTINRLTGRQRHPYLDIDTVEWPEVTVLIPAHNEENVIREVLEAVLDADYPAGRLRIIPINDRSEDDTGQIIDEVAAANPGRLTAFHRTEGQPGKAAALRDAMKMVDDEFVLVFDADYIPGTGLIKQLMAPFFDPEVGAVMGRVVPHNVGQNLLTRMLDLERAGGYQVDQQARMNLKLVPQYGGTVGGIRVRALEAVGGWRTDSLAEDTDATYRLLLGGWKTVYQNRSECYEQVPDNWNSRMTQIFRWTLGHNQTLVRYFFKMLRNRRTRFSEKLDGLLLLGIYWMSPVMLLGWVVGGALWYLGINKPGLIIILAVTCYSTVGNFAVFYEIATAAHLDGTRGRIRLLPFVLMGFLVSLVSVTRATFTQMLGLHGRDGVFWHKTKHEKRGTE